MKFEFDEIGVKDKIELNRIFKDKYKKNRI